MAMTYQLSEERVEPIRCWEEEGSGWKSGVRVREGLLGFMSPDLRSRLLELELWEAPVDLHILLQQLHTP